MAMAKKALFNICLFVLIAVFAIPSAMAQQEFVDTAKIQQIPSFNSELSAEKFTTESKLHEDEPANDRFLAYSIRLPLGWVKGTGAGAVDKLKEDLSTTKSDFNRRVLGRVAEYYGPGRIDAQSRFEIQAQALEFEVTAKNWFMQEVLTRGYILEGLKVVSDSRVEGLYVMVERDVAYVVRAAAEINGARMVMASYYVPDNHWEEERAQQQYAIESFKFKNPEKSKIESTRRYSFLDLLSFEYPASWRLIAPDIVTIEGMEATLIHSIDQKKLAGEIHISVISTEFDALLQDELGFLRQEITGRGLIIGELVETKKEYAKPEQVFYNHTEVYQAVDPYEKVLAHEYWMAIMEEERYFYVVTMLTPARGSEFYTWARNAEAFQTVVESFRQ